MRKALALLVLLAPSLALAATESTPSRQSGAHRRAGPAGSMATPRSQPPATATTMTAPIAGQAVRVPVTLDAVAVPGGPSLPASWTLVSLAEPNRTVYSGSGHPRPTLQVAPGRYEARVVYGAVHHVEQFEVSGTTPRHVQRIVLDSGTLRPVAGLAARTPPVDGSWTVLAEAVPGRDAGEVVATSTAREPAFNLPRGRYRLVFRAGLARAEGIVAVAPGASLRPRLALGAAEVTLVSLRGGRPLLGVEWQVYGRHANGARPGPAEPLAIGDAPRARFVLPAGAYVARVRADGRWYEAPFLAAAGTVREIPLPLP